MSPETMQIIIVSAVAFVAAALLTRKLLAKTGFGRPGGKPDCGCGHCAEKQQGEANK